MCVCLCVHTEFNPRRLPVLVLGVLYSHNEAHTCTFVCVCLCVGCHNRSSICWCHLVTNLVSPAPVETRHTQTHTHTELYDNVNLVSPENAAFDLNTYSTSLLPLLSSPPSSLSHSYFSSFSSSILHTMKMMTTNPTVFHLSSQPLFQKERDKEKNEVRGRSSLPSVSMVTGSSQKVRQVRLQWLPSSVFISSNSFCFHFVRSIGLL